MNDKVSIIMACYNCESTVEKAIDSILKQTYKNWELIICNDCSTDNTLEILKNYLTKYPDKIKLIQNDKNLKLPASLNHCLKYADGKYVARMDGDDVSHPQRLEKQVKYLEDHTDIDLVGTSMEVFNGKEITGIISNISNPTKYDLKKSPCFCHATIMTYKYVYDKLNGYTLNKRAIRCEDVDLWFRFFAAGYKGANIQECLYIVTDDENAHSRRKFTDRINAMKTLFFGYRLLKYPIYWYPWVLNPVVKGLVPKFIYTFLRNQKFK